MKTEKNSTHIHKNIENLLNRKDGKPPTKLAINRALDYFYKDNFDDVGDSIISFKQLFRTIILFQTTLGFSIIATFLVFFVDECIRCKVNSKYEKQVLKEYNKALEKLRKEYAKTDDPKKRKEIKAVIDKAENKLYELERYFNRMKYFKKNKESKADDDEIYDEDWSE